MEDGEELKKEREIEEYENIRRVKVRKEVEEIVKEGIMVRSKG